MKRTAKCSCGQLKVFLKGEPLATYVCNCNQCQRRTGSAFGVGAYFNETQVIEIQGSIKVFNQIGDEQRNVERHFCETCGTTVFWKADFQPRRVGVAVGCFTNPNFPEPSVSVWNCSKFEWVKFPKHWTSLFKQDAVDE